MSKNFPKISKSNPFQKLFQKRGKIAIRSQNIISFIKNGDDSELNHFDRLVVDQEVELALFQRVAAETKLEMKDFLARKL